MNYSEKIYLFICLLLCFVIVTETSEVQECMSKVTDIYENTNESDLFSDDTNTNLPRKHFLNGFMYYNEEFFEDIENPKAYGYFEDLIQRASFENPENIMSPRTYCSKEHKDFENFCIEGIALLGIKANSDGISAIQHVYRTQIYPDIQDEYKENIRRNALAFQKQQQHKAQLEYYQYLHEIAENCDSSKFRNIRAYCEDPDNDNENFIL